MTLKSKRAIDARLSPYSDSFALLPKVCDLCGRRFVFESFWGVYGVDFEGGRFLRFGYCRCHTDGTKLVRSIDV